MIDAPSSLQPDGKRAPAYWENRAEWANASAFSRIAVAANLAWWAGFRLRQAPAFEGAPAEPEWRRATRIIVGESGGWTLAFNDDGGELGLAQWHPRWWGTTVGNPRIPRTVQADPWLCVAAMRAVVTLYRLNPGGGWRSWWGPTKFHQEVTIPDGIPWEALDTFGAPDAAPLTYAEALDTTYGQTVLAGDGLYQPPPAVFAFDGAAKPTVGDAIVSGSMFSGMSVPQTATTSKAGSAVPYLVGGAALAWLLINARKGR